MPAKKIYRLDLSFFKRLPHLEFGHWVVSFGDALIVHPGYQAEGSIPHPLGNGPALRQMGTNFLDVHAAAETKHVDRVKERDALRPVVELQCAGTAQWTVLRSAIENDASLIANLPLPLKKQSPRTITPVVVAAPRNPKVKHGHTTVVVISTDKVLKARTYEVGICVGGDPSQESSWSLLGPFEHCRHMEITGLEPGKLYYFRVRCFIGGVFSPWSEMVSIRAL